MSEIIEPVEIAPSTYWVGKRDPKSIFFANPYLRCFKSADGKSLNLLIDPGSSSDFAVVGAKVRSLIGDLRRLSGVFVNHQDPDVGSSTAVIMGRHTPTATLLCSEETWRLIACTNIPRGRLVPTNKFKRGIKLSTGHMIYPVPSPFCHFRGAVMLYDPENRVLFSGDLFGSLTEQGKTGLWADESDWTGMRAFHQLYMPTTAAIKRTIETIRKLDPFPEIIAPQHGRLLRGKLVEHYISKLERLPVGLDILDEDDDTTLVGWNTVMARVWETAKMLMGAQVDHLLSENEDLHDTLSFESEVPEITSLGRWTLSTVVHTLTDKEVPEIANPIRLEALAAADELGLPTPEISVDEQRVYEDMTDHVSPVTVTDDEDGTLALVLG